MTYEPDLRVIAQYLPELSSALLVTLAISLASFVIALVLGLPMALASLSKIRPLSAIGVAAMEVFRGTPEMVQLLWVYYVLPIVFGLPVGAVVTGVLGLGVSLSAYLAEVYRAGLGSVPKGNVEAARGLGMSRSQTLFRIQLPQAALIMIPGMLSNYILLLKRTSLLLAIAVPELMFTAYRLSSVTFRPLELLSTVALTYLAITFSLSWAVRRIENKLQSRRV